MDGQTDRFAFSIVRGVLMKSNIFAKRMIRIITALHIKLAHILKIY